ncbi:serine/threonine-protein kinase [Pseudoxanthomonas composti]|uniref:Serine/threonine protein kinase n=1 Tax=Pseudoxanthomonas composti TaxID=2137479 RepID=A0A4Q1JYA0_9GAMM|nr:serine/threonine-protein kinase [Pseudoxanthomonas composti]RXR06404.1 serine/threonine protein kinase [Pseudoxanthomonas composti]
MDAARWQRLSPQLDVLLELTATARATRLAAIRAEDPALADELIALLALEEDQTSILDTPLIPERAPPDLRDTHIGPYRLLQPLGEGGMGMVWLAERADGLYERKVALKLLRPGVADPGLQERFARERQILGRLAHPNIARLLGAGVSDQHQPYLVLDYVEGETITDYCRRTPLTLEARLGLFNQVCQAVSHAHTNLVVHRDLKPSNILVTADGQVRLLDFGIAKLLGEAVADGARTEVRAFTLHYAAPEQIRGEPVSTRTDVYSLGVVLYELLTGDKPYRLRRQSDAEWERAILSVEPLKPSSAVLRRTDGAPSPEHKRLARQLRGDLDNITLKALAKAPEQRYSSVEALLQDLGHYREGRPVQARPQSLGYRLQKYVHRHRWGIAFGTLFSLGLLAAAGISFWQTRQAVNEARRAQAMQDFVIGLIEDAGRRNDGNTDETRRLLEEGERRGEQELAGLPAAHAELLGVLARLQIAAGDYLHALELLKRQRQLLQHLGSEATADLRYSAAAQHARVLRLLGRTGECVNLLAPLWPVHPLRDRLLSKQVESDYLSQYGRCRRLQGQREDAKALFERAMALRRQTGNDAGIAENLFDLALLQNDLGRAEDAIAGFRGALAWQRQRAGADGPLAVEILRSLGLAYRGLGDSDMALRTYDEAIALAEQSQSRHHPILLSLRRQRLAVEVDLGRYTQADAQMRTLLAQTVAALGPEHREVALGWNSLAIIAMERGQTAQALADVRKAVAIWRREENASLLAAGLFNYGLVLHEAGQDAQALRYLQAARQMRVARFGASHALVGETDRLIGETLAASDPAAAAPWLDRAVKLTRVGYGAQDPRTRYAEVTQARLDARSQPLDGPALQALDRLAQLPGGGSEIPKMRWRAQAFAAEARCRLGQRQAALASLEALQRTLARTQPDGGLIPRQVAQIRQQCQLQGASAGSR